MRLLGICFVIFFLCLCIPNLNAAKMYSWTDEAGVMHLSNQPPPENAKGIKEYDMIEESEKPSQGTAGEVMRSEPKEESDTEKKEENVNKFSVDFRRI